MGQLDDIEKTLNQVKAWAKETAGRHQWQPINTAPKNGQNILAFKDGIMTTVRWLHVEKYWTLCVPGTFILYHDWDPTHWMPLPAPPREKQQWRGGGK